LRTNPSTRQTHFFVNWYKLIGMAKTLKQDLKRDAPQMPFNEALKRVWASPPQPKIAKNKAKGKAKKKTGS
jgi:hypothetical protein